MAKLISATVFPVTQEAPVFCVQREPPGARTSKQEIDFTLAIVTIVTKTIVTKTIFRTKEM